MSNTTLRSPSYFPSELPVSLRLDFLRTETPQLAGLYGGETCPHCGSDKVHFHDGDSVYVPTLPPAVSDYDTIDTSLMVGGCASCGHDCYVVEYGFTDVPDPAEDGFFCVPNLPQVPDEVHAYTATSPGFAPWRVLRLFYDTGTFNEGSRAAYGLPPGVKTYLPKGSFVVDLHQLGPFPLPDGVNLEGPYGVSRCHGNSVWDQQEKFYLPFAQLAAPLLFEAAKGRSKHRP